MVGEYILNSGTWRRKAKVFIEHFSLSRWTVFIFDSILVFITFIFACVLSYHMNLYDFFDEKAIVYYGISATFVYSMFSLIYRPYSGMLRHTTIIDVFNVFVTTISSVVFLVIISKLNKLLSWNINFISPVSLLLVHYVLITMTLIVVRVAIKILFIIIISTTEKRKRILIYGAGNMGVIAKRVIQSDSTSIYKVAGFLDDNKNMQGKLLNGIPVFSPAIISEYFIKKHNIGALIFAIEGLSAERKSQMIRRVLDLNVEILQTPAVETWLNGQFHMNQVIKVDVNDLLGRDPIKLDLDKIGIGLKDKTILVTGAAGSIGSEIVRQLAFFSCKKMILVDQAETPMFFLGNELIEKFGLLSVKLLVADITHFEKMDSIFKEWKPDIVFHAAAYKHVPLMEENPHEAIRVNVGGIKILTHLTHKYRVKKFVMVSTDKAVNPTNIMGASKRICELIVQQNAKIENNQTQFITTRFGNVLGSNGSVIPIFSKQIERGGPITVTHPEITRYFMTIPEACQLVLEAGFMGQGGEIYEFDMGEPVKIADLARQMIRLSGLIPDEDIKIVYTNLRPGEKLYEELLSDQEVTKPTHHPKIKIAMNQHLNGLGLIQHVENLLEKLYTLSKEDVVANCQILVPEYIPHENYMKLEKLNQS